MGLGSKLKTAGLWQALQTGTQVITQFVYMAIMARLLSKADFGLMALALAFIGFGAIFSEGGMSAALIQRKNITSNHINAAMQSAIIFGLIVFIIFLFTAEYVSSFFEEPKLELVIKIVGINVILRSLSSVSIGLLQKYFRFKQTASFTIIASLLGCIFGLILAYKGFGVWSLVGSVLLNSFLTTISFLYLAPVKFSYKLYFKEWKELFSFGSGMIFLQLANFFSNKGLNLVVGSILPTGLLGVFDRSYAIKTLPSNYLGEVIDRVMFPGMSEIQDENERLFSLYQYSLGLVNSILMPIALTLIFFTHEIVLILLGDNWLEAVIPTQIMFFVIPFSSSGRMADSVIRSKGLIYKNVFRKFIYVIILSSSVFVGAYYYGIIGAAIAVTFSYIFNFILMVFLVKKIFNKSIADVFLIPFIEGFKLSFIVFILIFIISTITNTWFDDLFINFFIIISILATLTILAAFKKPSLLGKYILQTINNFLKTN